MTGMHNNALPLVRLKRILNLKYCLWNKTGYRHRNFDFLLLKIYVGKT